MTELDLHTRKVVCMNDRDGRSFVEIADYIMVTW